MKRRDFTRSIITTGLVTPAILSGSAGFAADEKEKEKRTLDPVGRVLLKLVAGQILVEFLIILSPVNLLGLDLRKPVRQENEKRADLSNLPILGQLQRQTLARQFENAALVGLIYLVGSSLFLIPKELQVLNVKKVIMLHQGISYHPSRAPSALRISRVPTVTEIINAGTLLGEAIRAQNSMLVLLKPTGIEFRLSYE